MTLSLLEFDPEGAALAEFGFHAHFAAHAFDRLFYNGQTNAGAFEVFAHLLEHLKYFFVLIGGDADPVILHE